MNSRQGGNKKRSVKPTRKRTGRRDLFAELSQGMDALADERSGKRTLRTHSMEFKPRRRSHQTN